MKERIENKLLEHADKILKKENISEEEIIFLIFLLNRIELKENEEKNKIEREETNKIWRERMANMLDMTGGK